MLKLYDKGVYLLNGTEIVEEKEAVAAKTGKDVTPQEAAKNTMAYNILAAHNTSGNMERLQIKFDKLTSHDITFVGIIQTARASGLEKFPILMYLRTVITLFVQSEERSTKMITCSVSPARKNMAESMYRLIRQSSTSLP
mgnify:FL=1